MSEKARRIQTVVRLCLSGGLVYLIYRETGPWTALFAALSCIAIEALQHGGDGG